MILCPFQESGLSKHMSKIGNKYNLELCDNILSQYRDIPYKKEYTKITQYYA